MSYERYLGKIVHSLNELNVYKIILIGSYASARYTSESDVDIVVVLDSEHIPQTYREKMDVRLSVRQKIHDISEEIPIDLIVYTKGEYEQLKNLKTSFSQEIASTGKVLYEKAG